MLQKRIRGRGVGARAWKLSPLLVALAFGVLLSACTAAGSSSAVPSTAGAATPAASASPPANPLDRPAAASGPGTGGGTQKSEGGQVTLAVTWQGAAAGPVFTVVMDTHAVDLDGYDLRQLAVLRTEDGRELMPTGWDAPKGGHHREGLLTFPAATPDGRKLLAPGRSIELTVRDVAGVPERKFRWIG